MCVNGVATCVEVVVLDKHVVSDTVHGCPE